jgi:hypothetical protein
MTKPVNNSASGQRFESCRLTDEELLNIASQGGTLANEASRQLFSELDKRGLSASDVSDYAAVTREIEKQVGNVTIVIPGGIGRVFLGKSNYVGRGTVEELDTTLWLLIFGLPIFPIASYRVRRPKDAGLLDSYTFHVIEKYPRNWGQIGLTILKVYGGMLGAISVLTIMELARG